MYYFPWLEEYCHIIIINYKRTYWGYEDLHPDIILRISDISVYL